MYDGANRRWYIDGVLDGSDFPNDSTISDTAYRLVFGARNNSDSDPNNIGNHSHAQLDDIYIYDRAVTEGEASALLNNITAKPALDLRDTDVTVATDATLFSDTPSTATYGDLTLGNGVTLDLSGAPKGISFDVVSGYATVNLTDPDPDNEMRIRGGIRPGDSLGVLSMGGDLVVEDDVLYEWELGPKDGTPRNDLVDFTDPAGTLTLDDWTLQLVDAGGEAHFTERLYLFTGFEGDPVLTGSMVNFGATIDTSLVDHWLFTESELMIGLDSTGLYLGGLQTVPEPSSLLLLALGGIALLWWRRRR